MSLSAPDVFRSGQSIPMQGYAEDDEVDFVVIGTGAGGGTLTCRLAEAGFRVVALEAGPFWRPLDEFSSDEKEQQKLYWTDERITAGENPIALGSNNSGKGVGGSTVHFTMVSLRFRPEWFRARSALGYGVDWPITYEELEPYYREVEKALGIAGPVRYPWGPPRGRYPYRPHEVNAAGLVLARGCERIGIPWVPAPLATLSAPRGKAHPCVYRGFCSIGCSTNAKQSVLVTWIPRAIHAGAEIRDRSMAARIEVNHLGQASDVIYVSDGVTHRQRTRHVVVAAYSIETPRLLLNSVSPAFPDGLANRSGMVGKCLMVHSNDGVWATFDEEIRSYKGPPVMAMTEHWNYTDEGKDFSGGYQFGSQGPLPGDWAKKLAGSRGLWGMELRQEAANYIYAAGFKMVGEVEPREENRVELSDERDQNGLPIPRITFSYSENDKKLKTHAVDFMKKTIIAAGGRDVWTEEDTAHLVGGCRMGIDAETSVTNSDGRSWDVPNLWICDGSLFPTSGGVNPSETIQALACRIADRIVALGRSGEV